MGARPDSFTHTAPGPVRIYSTREMLHMPSPEWQIQDTIPQGGLVGLYGPPGIGKSFLAADICLSIGAGGFWQGRTVQPGYGLYVCAEGSAGTGKRIKAWTLDRGVDADDIAVGWITEAIPVTTDSMQMELLINRIEDELISIPSFIVIDTLARCFDGDENTQLDMGRFVAGIDRLRKEFDATVMVVHHTRLDGERERGNTAFRGAADTMLSLALRKGVLTLACNKQKDAADFADMVLELKAVPQADSCVISVAQPATSVVESRAPGILAVLVEAGGALSWDDWRALSDLPKSSFHRIIVELENLGKIEKRGVFWTAI